MNKDFMFSKRDSFRVLLKQFVMSAQSTLSNFHNLSQICQAQGLTNVSVRLPLVNRQSLSLRA